jgi:hypothetical protein
MRRKIFKEIGTVKEQQNEMFLHAGCPLPFVVM